MSEQKEMIQTSIGTDVPRNGNIILRGLAIGILGLLGWSIRGELPNLSKFVVIGAPHTSNWDWLLVMAVAYALGVRISWMMKHTLFRGPFKHFFTWLGGIAIDRRATNGVVGESINRFQQASQLVLCITPEGTRSKVKEWKTGFYHIAQGAGVPIVPAIFDYGRKEVRFAPVFIPTGNVSTDLPNLQAIYRSATPKNRHLV
ncbi:MAG: lysophospholipid acyltransferase family protein [Candidatus Promineifilaceae bacterium]|nr:lysophospholipid acyltransferase family protein [Chloroflexota bacterium]